MSQPNSGTNRLANFGADAVEGTQSFGQKIMLFNAILGFIVVAVCLGFGVHFFQKPEPPRHATQGSVTGGYDIEAGETVTKPGPICDPPVSHCDNEGRSCRNTYLCMCLVTFTDHQGTVRVREMLFNREAPMQNGNTMTVEYVIADGWMTACECPNFFSNRNISYVLFAISGFAFISSIFALMFRKNKAVSTVAGASTLVGMFK